MRVLVAEDRLDLARTLLILFKAAGHEAESAADGLTAVEQAENFRPHVALVDIGLPDIDGCEVARRIRRNPNLSLTRLIAVTGLGEEESDRIMQAGFEKQLTKPVEPSDLLDLLEGFRKSL